MTDRLKEIAASGVVFSVVGYVVWPLGDVPWKWITYVPEPLDGDFAVLAMVLLSTAAIGFGVTAVSDFRLSNLAIGGVLAYSLWMAVLTLVISFHEPLLPFIAYGVVLVGILLGAAVETSS